MTLYIPILLIYIVWCAFITIIYHIEGTCTGREPYKQFPLYFFMVRKFSTQFNNLDDITHIDEYKLFNSLSIIGKIMFIMSANQVVQSHISKTNINVLKCILSFLGTITWYIPLFLIQVIFEIIRRSIFDDRNSIVFIKNDNMYKQDKRSIFEKLYR